MFKKYDLEDEEDEPQKVAISVSLDSWVLDEVSRIVRRKKSKGRKSNVSSMINVLLKYGLRYRANKIKKRRAEVKE